MGQEEQTDIVFKIIVGLGIHNSLPDNSFNGQMLQFQSETASLTDLAEAIHKSGFILPIASRQYCHHHRFLGQLKRG